MTVWLEISFVIELPKDETFLVKADSHFDAPMAFARLDGNNLVVKPIPGVHPWASGERPRFWMPIPTEWGI